MDLTGQHILSSDQFDLETLDALYDTADLLVSVAKGRQLIRILEGAVLASLFFEPSTRTRLSFDAAFMRLGGAVSHTTGVVFSSIMKGASIADTARVISGYADVMVIRHEDENAIVESAQASLVPVINGGNGAGEHPTQALLDLYTIRSEFQCLGREINGSRVALVGDLKYGRTIHSLIKLLSLHQNLTIVCVSPPHLTCPQVYLDLAAKAGHRIEICADLCTGIAGCDLLYATRIQAERAGEDVLNLAGSGDFRITKAKLNAYCLPHCVVMHPLPRDSRLGAQDLAEDTKADPRLAIFRQSDSGVPVRMALFAHVLGIAKKIAPSLKNSVWSSK
ncbi:MAG: aspartate carbamoyltransferase [Alphaproteobacteria bacterium]|nr:aspartate carbamoyltransferase [Alphaproteobacteria bacterium]